MSHFSLSYLIFIVGSFRWGLCVLDEWPRSNLLSLGGKRKIKGRQFRGKRNDEIPKRLRSATYSGREQTPRIKDDIKQMTKRINLLSHLPGWKPPPVLRGSLNMRELIWRWIVASVRHKHTVYQNYQTASAEVQEKKISPIKGGALVCGQVFFVSFEVHLRLKVCKSSAIP